MTVDSALIDARARWELMLQDFRKKGLPEEQCWPFPADIKQAEKLLTESQSFLLRHPDTYSKGGLYEHYRNRLDEVLGYYSIASSGRSDRRKTSWTLVIGVLGTISAIVAAVGGVGEVMKFVKSVLRIP